jgi:Uma2 family endonuclease
MQLILPEHTASARLIFDSSDVMSDEAYASFCDSNPELRIERTAKGEIVIVPPAGGESDYRSLEIAGELRAWAKKDGRGVAFGASVAFLLPDGAALSPDAAWVSNERLGRLSKEQRRKFLRLVPDFVAEVMSPTDRLPGAQAKMRAWLENGVSLGWLIDGDTQMLYVFRPGREMETKRGVTTFAAGAPLNGFVIDFGEIWAGL